MNTRSLRFQLLVWYTSLLIAAFVSVGVVLYFAVKQALLQNLKELLDRRVRQIAHIVEEANRPLASEWLKEQIYELYKPETPESNGRFVRVTDVKTGEVIYRTGPPSNALFDPLKIPPVKFDETRP